MLHMFANMDAFGTVILLLIVLTVAAVGVSTCSYILFSTGNDEEIGGESDSTYAFYGAKRRASSIVVSKKVTFDI